MRNIQSKYIANKLKIETINIKKKFSHLLFTYLNICDSNKRWNEKEKHKSQQRYVLKKHTHIHRTYMGYAVYTTLEMRRILFLINKSV